MMKGGLNSNEKIFLDAEQAAVIASGLVSTAETALRISKPQHNLLVEEAEELWNTTKSMPFGITELRKQSWQKPMQKVVLPIVHSN
ncbi:hypothetical protein QN324_01215 [Streptococcus agalactiae]|uniref:hypothetical protein n=1 Tax=Streptococcus agalactiae TaxID=1311 RepID=UPI003F13ED9E